MMNLAPRTKFESTKLLLLVINARRSAGWLAAYAAGLAATFGANYFTKAGQPALVYIVPALLLTAGVKAVARGELGELLGYKSARAAAAAAVAAAGNDRNGE